MFEQASIGAIVFFVRDLDRSVAWYRDTLQLQISTLDGHDGPFAMGAAGSIQIVLIPREEPAGRSPVVVFGLESGIYEVVEALAAKGVEIVVPVRAIYQDIRFNDRRAEGRIVGTLPSYTRTNDYQVDVVELGEPDAPPDDTARTLEAGALLARIPASRLRRFA